MNIIFSTIIATIIVFLLIIFAAWSDGKVKVRFAETVIDKICSLIDSKLELMTDQCESCPWYLVVYTKDSNYPIWISNNTIRSVHPDPEHCKITINQFNGEYMVIENVISYELCSANDLCEYDM